MASLDLCNRTNSLDVQRIQQVLEDEGSLKSKSSAFKDENPVLPKKSTNDKEKSEGQGKWIVLHSC